MQTIEDYFDGKSLRDGWKSLIVTRVLPTREWNGFVGVEAEVPSSTVGAIVFPVHAVTEGVAYALLLRNLEGMLVEHLKEMVDA